MKTIKFSKHSLEQMKERGATPGEAEEAIRSSEGLPAKKNRRAFRMNFEYNKKWGGEFYRTKQVLPIVVEEPDALIVVTVYVFYF